MFTGLKTDLIAPKLHRIVIKDPRIAAARKAGQFVIVRERAGAERIPLTFADADTCDESVMAQNGVEYQLVVTNCGSVVLEGVVVDDQTLFGPQGYFLSGALFPGVNNQVTIDKNDEPRLAVDGFCDTFADQLDPVTNKLLNTKEHFIMS